MITDADVKKLENTFASKKDLIETELRLNKRIDRVTKYVNFELEPINEFKKEFTEFKENTQKSLDWLVRAFKKFEERNIWF